ncbi:hypothetical protein BJV74DRAFT_102205 [Russula compacta]|nr:hypothetical protein BJV74DRAFT_102205 [Russula compacta]
MFSISIVTVKLGAEIEFGRGSGNGRRWHTSATRLHGEDTCERDAGCLPKLHISITYWHNTLSRYDACDYEDLDNILAALEHRDQARYILLHLTGVLSRVSARRMKEPFPSLTHLQFESSDDDVKAVPIIPDTFLGRSAPRLQSLILEGIAFPGLPKLLFSTRDLVSLYLTRVSISPEALADGLSTLPRLESLTIGDPSSHPDQTSRRPPPLTRTILPSLTCLEFNGTSEYLQGLVAPISAPLLDDVNIDILFSEVQPTSDTQLIRLIGQSENLKSPSQVAIQFEKGFTRITLRSPRPHRCAYFVLNIECEESAWRASLAAQFCSQSLPLLREVVRLTLTGSGPYPPDWQDQMSQAQWPEIFRPFTAVERSSTSDQVASLLVPTLSALTEERAGQVLPALHSIFLEDFKPHGSVYDAIMPFVTARRLCGHPVCVHPWLRVRPHDLWDD